MKHFNKQLIIMAIAIIALMSCKKSAIQIAPLASLNVTNAVINGAILQMNNLNLYISNNSYSQISLIPGQSLVNIYPYNAVNSPYFNQNISTINGGSYSLFLSGPATAIDATLVKETYQNYTDSTAGVRFINLSPNSNPISVNISGNANGSEVASLAYKSYSGFLKYPAKVVNTSYVFQFRDATTGTLIASTTLATPRFHNVTIVLRGLVNGSPAAGITTVNDY